jgi:solute carrier family 25 (peroxisomal adenine nucleotide transporter), member 17
VKNEGWERLYGGLMPSLVGTAASQVGSFASFVPHFVKVETLLNLCSLCYCQGVYYYFYQIFRNRAEARALERSRRGLGDGSVGMLQSLTVAALSG